MLVLELTGLSATCHYCRGCDLSSGLTEATDLLVLGALYFDGSPALSMIVATDVSDGDMLSVLRPCLLSESFWLGRHFPLFDLAPRSCARTLNQWTLVN